MPTPAQKKTAARKKVASKVIEGKNPTAIGREMGHSREWASREANHPGRVSGTASTTQTLQIQRQQRSLERYQQVMELKQKGYSQKAISEELQMGRKTVRRWLRVGQFPERKPPSGRWQKVTEFRDYLHQRWTEGCHNALRLFTKSVTKDIRDAARSLQSSSQRGVQRADNPTSRVCLSASRPFANRTPSPKSNKPYWTG